MGQIAHSVVYFAFRCILDYDHLPYLLIYSFSVRHIFYLCSVCISFKKKQKNEYKTL